MSEDERIQRVEEAIVIMKDLLLRHEDRLDEVRNEQKADRDDFNFKLNALIDSQIRTETELVEIKASIIGMNESIRGLKEVSQAHLQRIENLENK